MKKLQKCMNYCLMNFQANFLVHHKNVADRNYREIINFKKLDLCSIHGNVEKFPMFSGSVNWWNFTFPGLVHKCPYDVRFLNLDVFFFINFLIFMLRKSTSLMVPFRWFVMLAGLVRCFPMDCTKLLLDISMISTKISWVSYFTLSSANIKDQSETFEKKMLKTKTQKIQNFFIVNKEIIFIGDQK